MAKAEQVRRAGTEVDANSVAMRATAMLGHLTGNVDDGAGGEAASAQDRLPDGEETPPRCIMTASSRRIVGEAGGLDHVPDDASEAWRSSIFSTLLATYTITAIPELSMKLS